MEKIWKKINRLSLIILYRCLTGNIFDKAFRHLYNYTSKTLRNSAPGLPFNRYFWKVTGKMGSADGKRM